MGYNIIIVTVFYTLFIYYSYIIVRISLNIDTLIDPLHKIVMIVFIVKIYKISLKDFS